MTTTVVELVAVLLVAGLGTALGWTFGGYLAAPSPHPPAELPRPCLRHHMWMAVCPDCASAHRRQGSRP